MRLRTVSAGPLDQPAQQSASWSTCSRPGYRSHLATRPPRPQTGPTTLQDRDYRHTPADGTLLRIIKVLRCAVIIEGLLAAQV